MSNNQPLLNDSGKIPMAPVQPAFAQQQLAAFTKHPSEGTSAEFKVGRRSLPYLADYGFQDMIVLPGSLYVEMALFVHADLLKQVASVVRNAKFQNPVILSEDDSTIKVVVRDQGDGNVEYTFYEAVGDDSTLETRRQYCAKVEIESHCPASRESNFNGFSIKDFTDHSSSVINKDEFYKVLRENGNQYGPQFQNLSAVWRSGAQALGRLSFPIGQTQAGRHFLHPALVDSITQLLSAFIIEKGETFVLRSIERIEILDINFPDTLWARATLRSSAEDEKGFVGSVCVLDESGKRYLELSGVAFTYLDRVQAAEPETADKTTICIASTFTAEPLEDSLRFWSQYLGIPTDIEFAPYNQIFQELLGAGSALRRNRNGANVVLLGLEDWVERNQGS